MARKEKRLRAGALGELKEVVQKAGIHLKSGEPPAPPRVVIRQDQPLPPVADEELFQQAMQGVNRSSWRHNTVLSRGPSPARTSDPNMEERLLMRQAIEGELPPIVQEHPEYIEGWVGVVGKRYLPNLRTGLYSIQGQLDLHGFNQVEARMTVEDFVIHMSRFRSCCVKIIHGRGINSPDDRAVLKESLQRWLSTRRMSRYVVAYASAPLNDGGVGAVYVLLRHP